MLYAAAGIHAWWRQQHGCRIWQATLRRTALSRRRFDGRVPVFCEGRFVRQTVCGCRHFFESRYQVFPRATGKP